MPSSSSSDRRSSTNSPPTPIPVADQNGYFLLPKHIAQQLPNNGKNIEKAIQDEIFNQAKLKREQEDEIELERRRNHFHGTHHAQDIINDQIGARKIGERLSVKELNDLMVLEVSGFNILTKEAYDKKNYEELKKFDEDLQESKKEITAKISQCWGEFQILNEETRRLEVKNHISNLVTRELQVLFFRSVS